MRRLSAVFASAVLVATPVGCSDNNPKPTDTVEPDTDASDTADDTAGPDADDTAGPDADDTAGPDADDTAGPDADDTVDTSTPPDTTEDVEVVVPDSLLISVGDRCDSLVPLESPELPFSHASTTVGMSDDYIYTTGTACGGVGSALWGDASPDVVYAITPVVSGTYNVSIRPAAGFDPAIMVTDGCPPIGEDDFLGMTCLAVSDQGTEGSVERLRVPMIAGHTYYMLIDGWNNNVPVSGTYTFEMALGEDCGDGVDNDLNGATDCLDPQCTNDPLCDESNFDNGCRNGTDDDGDGFTDCADPDCTTAPACNEATYPNGCRNNADDDGDGLVDCADPDCAGLAACNESTYPNGCANNADDDGDGLTDCADPNCFSASNCNESTYANGCTNGLDDDGDGRTDCADPDCGSSPTCLEVGETCASPLVLIEGAPTNGTTVGRINDYTTSATSCLVKGTATSFGAATADAVYSFTPTATGRYDIRVTGNFDLSLTLTTDCSFQGSTCFGSERGLASVGERIVAQLTAGTTYFIIVDGWSNTNTNNAGNFVITAKRAVPSEVETLCENRLDEDGDGQTDCADPDCAFDLAACTEAGKCTDGLDNDNDGLTDCADPECRIDPVTCPRPIGDNCGNPLVVTTTAPVSFNTCTFDQDFTLNATGCQVGASGAPDGVASFTAPQAGNYWVEVIGLGSYDAVINVLRSGTCPSSITSCAASADSTSSGTEGVTIRLAANETIQVIVSGDGSTSTRCGTGQLKVSLLPNENCSNNIDDDRDGLTDCNDPDCRNSRSCNEYLNGDEACTDGLDNDNDGRIDCADSDCRADTELCPSPLGDNCHNPFIVDSTAWSVDTDTCTMTSEYANTRAGVCTSSGSAGDVVAKFVVPEDGNYRIAFDTNVGGTSFDAVLNVIKADSCQTGQLTECLIGSDQGAVESGRIDNAVAGDTYWVYVDGWATGCGVGRLSVVKLAPEVCGDGIDNDGNGLADCADTAACGQTALCNEALNEGGCTDGVDNDGDNLVDCYDRDCVGHESCPDGIPGDTCANPIPVTTESFSMRVDTCGYTNDFTWPGATCRGSGANTAPDVVIDFEPPVPGTYRVRFAPTTSADAFINVFKNMECPASPVQACSAGVDNGNPETIDLVAAEGDYFYIVLDNWGSGCATSDVTISRLAPEVCDDGVDNDGDGRADCNDSDCFGVGNCPAGPPGENCSAPQALTLGQLTSLDTCTYTKDFNITTGNGCINTTAAPDMLFTFTAATAGSYRFTTDADWLDFETVTNYVRGATCPGPTISQCTASSQSDYGDETQVTNLTMNAGETLWIILGANFSATECGPATIRVTAN